MEKEIATCLCCTTREEIVGNDEFGVQGDEGTAGGVSSTFLGSVEPSLLLAGSA